jgi:DNA-binding NarL/FixJ family response regulator
MTGRRAQPDPDRPARILLVDDHPIIRRGLCELIAQTPGLEVCGEAETPREALDAAADAEPDVAVVDLSLRDGSGLELIKDLAARHRDLPVLVLSMHDESLYAERALRAGAKGYIMKEEAPERLLAAIERVLDGEIYLSDAMASRVVAQFVTGSTEAPQSSVESLSDRELEVYEMIGNGLGTRDIARNLHLSVKTIETHRENIKRKLRLRNANELHQHAFLWVQRQGEE